MLFDVTGIREVIIRLRESGDFMVNAVSCSVQETSPNMNISNDNKQ